MFRINKEWFSVLCCFVLQLEKTLRDTWYWIVHKSTASQTPQHDFSMSQFKEVISTRNQLKWVLPARRAAVSAPHRRALEELSQATLGATHSSRKLWSGAQTEAHPLMILCFESAWAHLSTRFVRKRRNGKELMSLVCVVRWLYNWKNVAKESTRGDGSETKPGTNSISTDTKSVPVRIKNYENSTSILHKREMLNSGKP